MTKWNLSQVHKNGSTYANERDKPYKQKNKQNHMISTDEEKHLTNFHYKQMTWYHISTPIHDKNSYQSG